MWYKPCSREDLLDIIEQGGGEGVGAYEFGRFSDFSNKRFPLVAYWKDDPLSGSSIPAGVVVPVDEMRDFIAWVATYVPLRPFSAYCRIVDWETIDYFPDIHEPSLGKLENCYLGIILAESAKTTSTPEAMKQLSPAECEGALSFALARAIALGPGVSLFGRIETQWRKARLLIAQNRDRDDSELILRIFRIAAALNQPRLYNDTDELILECAEDIRARGEVQSFNWSRLTSGHPELAGAADFQKLRREDRVQRLRSVVVPSIPIRDARLSFAIGYLGSAIAPGTFDHYGTMRDMESHVPGVHLWYGLCAGLYKKNSLQGFSGGIGRRVVRDLERNDSVYARPYCDIAISELEVLLDADKKFDFKLGLPGTIEIELAPCITTFQSVQKRTVQRSDDVEELLRELDYKLQDIARLRNRLAHSIGAPHQKQLFSASRGRRS